ncbi:MAG: hypothetical protein O7G87_17885 [bacterium]|nr:hypothetical protein [bacterium]
MPIFISRFSSGRVSGANLQQVRAPQNQTVRQAQAGEASRQRRAPQNRQVNPTRREQVERVRESLLARTQQGERLAQQLREPGDTTGQETEAAEQTTTRNETQPATDTAAETTRQRQTGQRAERTTQRPLPGVGVERSQAERNVDRPGRLRRAPANPAREQLLSRFSGLRAAAGRGNQADQANRAGTNAAARTTSAEQPTAVEISRANTTPEIQGNLQADTRDVGRGLQRDAVRQTQLNTQRTAQSAERDASTRQERVQRESQSQARALRTEQRQLERQLRDTQQEIRSQETRGRQAQSLANRSTVATAAQIGTNVNILAA